MVWRHPLPLAPFLVIHPQNHTAFDDFFFFTQNHFYHKRLFQTLLRISRELTRLFGTAFLAH
jgi:hypothetical protein